MKSAHSLTPPLSLIAICVLILATISRAESFDGWKAFPHEFGGGVARESALTLQSNGGAWNYALSPDSHGDLRLRATIKIDAPATEFAYFGESWSVWPSLKYDDQGFETAVLLRFQDNYDGVPGSAGYRVQLSHRYQELALTKFPDGGYVRSVPCKIGLDAPHRVEIVAKGPEFVVSVDGAQKIRFRDRKLVLESGRIGFGVSSRAKVTISEVAIEALQGRPRAADQGALANHAPNFRVRNWLGGRPWIFDGDEPILLPPSLASSTVMNVKLRPGFKPQLTWNAHWDIQNQGAYKEGHNEMTAEPTFREGGETLKIQWQHEHIGKRYDVTTALTVSWNPERQCYAYDVDSALEVRPGEPFHFKYGYDFEHHTPLDPFRWKYLMIKPTSGAMTYRPLSPFDPGPMHDLAIHGGTRIWHGRTDGPLEICPAVEYEIDAKDVETVDHNGQSLVRQLNTAVCAAFYDTGVSFAGETAAPGTRVKVKYRYTGVAVDEARQLLADAVPQDNPRIDPEHHFLFARDQWPTIRFGDALAMDKPWWGGRPFLSGHNARPTYDWAMLENGRHVIRLAAVSYGLAPVGPGDEIPGRYSVTAKVKSINVHGPGGRIEVLALKNADPAGNNYLRHGDRIIAEETRYFPIGTTDWQTLEFVFEAPAEARGLALGLGNAGTGEVLVSQVTFRKLRESDSPPAETAAVEPAPSQRVPDTIADFRMQEQSGLRVFNHAEDPHSQPVLDLANLTWVQDEGRSALRFAEPARDAQPVWATGAAMERYLGHSSYAQVQKATAAIAGHHGGGSPVKELTLAAWIKPAAELGMTERGISGRGVIVGFGARRFVLALAGPTAPYHLEGNLNVNDRFAAKEVDIPANRWTHVAMTCATESGKYQVRLFIDGKPVFEGQTENFAAPANAPRSTILGAEIFYLHDAFYRGLIGRTLVFERALTDAEIARLAAHR